MIKLLLTFIVLGVVLVFGISTYLGPDNLKGCDPYPTDKTGCQAVGAIVAISGGDTTARTSEAIELYKNGWAPLLVLSGAAADTSGPSNAEVMEEQALNAGVPASAILLDSTSVNTKENADNSVDIFKKHGIDSVILVTSAYHQRRAGLEFKRRAGDGINVINHPVSVDNQWNSWWWITPRGWWLATTEMVKIIAFYIGIGR